MAPRVKRRTVSDFVRRKVIHLAGNRCSFCPEDDVSILQPHHITAVSKGGSNDLENLIAVCPTCHEKIHRGTVSTAETFAKKALQPVAPTRRKKTHGAAPVVEIQGDLHQSTVAVGTTVNIRTGARTKAKIVPAADSLAAAPSKLRYCRYLVDRYHEFKRWEVGKGQMNYAILYASIKREFKAALPNIPAHRFDDVTEYLQGRILKSTLGRNLNAQGQKVFENFEEYVLKHG